MSALSIQPTYPIFTETDGQPLENGYIWIGTANLDPQVNPIAVYWDAALTQLAAQPIRTEGGYPVNSGTPARLYVNSDYSIRVMNKNGSAVYSAPAATERYSNAVVSVNAVNVEYTPPFTGSVTSGYTVEDKLAQTVSVRDFGAVGDGITDDAASINAAVTAVAALGGGRIIFGPGTYIVGSAVELYDNVQLHGANQKATILKLKSSANTNIIQKKSGAVGLGAGLFDLTIDGNDVNNTSGGVYWAGSNTGRGPSFTFERVTVKNCRPVVGAPSSEYAAILTTGATWGVARDLDVDQNQYAVGWWHKGSDWQIDNLYLGPNGANYGGTGTQSLIIQGGAGNLFTSCYFGGNGGTDQVFLWGSQRNLFVNCINDNSWESAYRFDALAGTGANDNRILGGQIRGASGKTNLGFPAVNVIDSTGNVFSDVEWSGNVHTSSGNAADYGFEESGTASGNYIVGGNVAAAFGTGFVLLAGGSTTFIAAVFGYDVTSVGTLNARTKVQVYADYDDSVPTVNSVPLGRFNQGTAVSVWIGAKGYSYGWLQAIQDDGTGNLKELRLQPLGGPVIIPTAGGGLTVTSPNGLITRKISIDNSGNVVAV